MLPFPFLGRKREGGIAMIAQYIGIKQDAKGWHIGVVDEDYAFNEITCVQGDFDALLAVGEAESRYGVSAHPYTERLLNG